MAEKKENRAKRKTQVKELPQKEKELSKGEQKKIKGGPRTMLFMPSISRDGGDSN